MEAVVSEAAEGGQAGAPGGEAAVLEAGSGTARPTAPEWLQVGSVALAVRDLDRMEAFYRYVIGLQDVAREPGLVRLGIGDHAVLDLLHRPDALPDDPASAGLFHVAYLLPSRAQLGRWLAHHAALGQRLDGAADHLVSEAAYLHDPEGNGIEVYADRPRAAWRWHEIPDAADPGGQPGGYADGRTTGRRVEMANRPLDRAGLLRDAERSGLGSWSGAPEGTRIGHVHLRVGDVAEARRFYGQELGMDVTASSPEAAFLSTGGYHHHVAVNTWHSRGAGPRDPRRAGLASVTFDVLDDIPGHGAGGAGACPDAPGRHVPPRVARRVNQDVLHDPWGTALRFRPAPSCHADSTQP